MGLEQITSPFQASTSPCVKAGHETWLCRVIRGWMYIKAFEYCEVVHRCKGKPKTKKFLNPLLE